VDPDDPNVADVITAWKKTPGTVGVPHHADEGAGARPPADRPGSAAVWKRRLTESREIGPTVTG
jgi:hypothetical protein